MNTKTADKIETAPESMTTKAEVIIFQKPRLPYHDAVQDRYGVDKGGWKVLVEAIFPSAKTVDSVIMALSYCKQRNLDIFKRPVHIVPMWSSQLGRMVETVWPSISELRTTAFRTGNYAGKSATVFGPVKKQKFEGTIEGYQGKPDRHLNAEVEFPEWAQVTLTRVLNGQKCEFVSPKVYWLESYGRQGKTDVPNEMWQKRPNGQLEKCVEAAGLRVAFPEEIGNEYAAEEMEGQRILDPAEHAKDITPKDKEPPAPPPAESVGTVSTSTPHPNVAEHAAGAESPQSAPAVLDPEAMLKWIDDRLAKITDPFDLPDVWETECLPKLVGAFPPDQDAANAIYDRHEKRLEPK